MKERYPIMKRLVSLLLSCLLLSSCGTIVTPAKTPPEHLVSEAPPAQVLPAPGEMPELLPDSQEAGGENASEPSPEEGGGTPVETLPEPQRVVDPTRPMVALTFDDGPHAVYTDQILDILEEHGAVATFFEVARNLPKAPEAVRRAADMGCEIGSHSYRHANLGKMDQAAQQADQAAADALAPDFPQAPKMLLPMYIALLEQSDMPDRREQPACAAALEYLFHRLSGRKVDLRRIAAKNGVSPRLCRMMAKRILRAVKNMAKNKTKGSAEHEVHQL